MQAPGVAEILALWERAQARHPLDRALLLCAWARPDLAASRLPDLPLGTINRSLLRLRELCFGAHISAWTDCERCQQRLEISLDTGQLLAAAEADDTPAEFEISGLRFRVPCSRDLAAISGEQDINAAAVKLLRHCCLETAEQAIPDFTGLLGEAGEMMGQLDPAAVLNLSLNCGDCGHNWLAAFDIGNLLWDEIDARARSLLAEVHSLATAYGWTEAEILSLSAQRRTTYLEMVGT